MALAFVLMSAGCATYSTVSGVLTPLGYFTSEKVNASREGNVIAQYAVILGLITTGYEEFLANTQGQNIDIINTDYFGYYTVFRAVRR